jgi:hypothetical protein
MPNELFTVAEVAAFLRVSEDTCILAKCRVSGIKVTVHR